MREMDSIGNESIAAQQAGKRARTDFGDDTQTFPAPRDADASSGDAANATDRMHDWQPDSLIGAMGMGASDGGAPLPAANRAAAESSLGVDLSSVRVHTDAAAQAAAASLSAQAYTQGEHIYFGAGHYAPGTASGDQLISHELVHVAQQRGGFSTSEQQPPQRKALVPATVAAAGPAPGFAGLASPAVTDIAEPAELEADRGAAAIAAGQTFSAREQPTGLARAVTAPETLAGNPAERVDSTGAARTTHRSPTVRDAANAPSAGRPPDVDARAANVKVLAPRARPLHFDAPAGVEPSSLYEEGASGSPAPAGYTTVTTRLGSADAPIVEEKPAPGLFIADQPSPGDVDQGGIGDCYLMSALAGIAARDPGHLKAMMKPDGAGGATVTLWRRQDHQRTLLERVTSSGDKHDYTPVQITVNDELAVNVKNGRIHGAGLRCAEQPSSVDYWAELAGGALEVHRKDVYECARWVPLLEKAYARFCQAHDQYGGSAPASADTNPANPSGYEGLIGGFSYHALPVLYGPRAQAEGDLHLTSMSAFPTAGSNILAANPQAVEQLLLLAGRKDLAEAGDTTAPILTANTSPTQQINNLGTALAAAMADPDYALLDAQTQLKLTALRAAVLVWQALPPDPAGTQGAKAAARSGVGNLAVEVARTPNHHDLAELRSQVPTPIRFDADSDAVRPADATRLTHFGKWLQYESTSSLCPFVVTMEGHSSSDGDEAENQAVSERRATNTHAAVLAGHDAAKMARHTYQVRGVGERGAAPGAAWRRVDLSVAPDRADNELFAGARSPAMRALMDLVLNVRNLGTDSSSGQRNVYANHAYSVVSVSFLGFGKTAMPLQTMPAAARPGMYGLVDCEASTVRLRNPHHGNEPDRTGMGQPTHAGDGAPSGKSADGVLTMSINEFFRNFNSLDSGVLPKTPE